MSSSPWPAQARTCISGQHCSFLLLGLQPSDLVLALDTCGLPALIPRWPAGGLSLPVGGVGTNGTVPANGSSIPISQRLSWGGEPVTAVGGEYRLCWCSASSVSCDTFADFLVDLASLHLLGPQPHAMTCVSGRACQSSIQGHMISTNDSIWVLETCGVQGHKFEFAMQSTISQPEVSTVQMAISRLVGLGKHYKLCWCASGCPCADGRDFIVEAGDLILQGPSNQQDRTCISGRTCLVEGIQGQDLSDLDHYLIQDTCGADQVVESLVNVGSHVEVTSSGAVVHWGGTPHTVAGGMFQLCWCTNRPIHGNVSVGDLCGTSASFVSTVGSLSLRGPSPLAQDRTCISGKTCKVTGLEGHLFSFGHDRVMVLDTCAKLGSAGYAVQANVELGGVLKFQPEVPLYGGIYRLCWCGRVSDMIDTGPNQSLATAEDGLNVSGCQLPEEHQTDFGELHVVGPRPAETALTCVAGQLCNVRHMDGHLLTSQSPGSVLILDTCGVPMQSLTTHNALTNFTESPAAHTLLNIPVYGGFYRLCWCYVGCSSETAYAIDVGQVWLLGPSAADHHRTCISGRMCRVRDILGVGLSSADRAMLMDTCGSPTYVSGVVSAGMSNMFANATSFVWNVVTAHGGQYKLCWCTQNDAVALARTPVSPSFVTVPNCSDSTRFGQEFGRLYLLGPSHPDQSFTCVGGQTCQIRSLHDPHASIEDSLLLLDTCGSSVSYVPRSTMQPATTTQRDGQLVFEWHGVQTMQGGQYRLCWCTTRSGDGVNASALDLCEQPEHFLVDYGQLHVVGPSLNQIRTCVAGWPCHLRGIEGMDLQAGDMYLILDTCGAASLVPESPSGFLESSGNRGTDVAFRSPVSASGGSYRICWCGRGFPCSSFKEFSVDLGEMVLQGPSTPDQSFTCIRGQRCRVSHIQGVLSTSAEFLILETCAVAGRGTATSALPVNGSHGSSVLWDMKLTLPGGEYRLCWCADGVPRERSVENQTLTPSEWAMLATNASSPFNVSFFSRSPCLQPAQRVDVGSLHLVGPLADQTFTCISGQRCVVDSVLGLGLSNNDSYLLLATCGIPSITQRFTRSGHAVDVATGGTTVSWGVVPLTAAGGAYRLCWCAPEPFNVSDPCASAMDYAADVGTLFVIGASPLEQDRTCVSGWPCVIDGTTGIGLTEGDALAVLETCGQAEAPVVSDGSEARLAVALSPVRGLWQWMDGNSVAVAGSYRLCWCSGAGRNSSFESNSSCVLHTDFRVDIGALTVLGPAPLQQAFTCVSGHSCSIDAITGVGLSQDSIMILDTCGSEGDAQLSVALKLDAVSIARLTMQGGQYNLCWCPQVPEGANTSNGTGSWPSLTWNETVQPCQNARDFTVSFGHMQIIGPHPGAQDRTCVSGQTCRIESMQGLHLSERDSWFVLETCGSIAPVAGFPTVASVQQFQADNLTSPSSMVVTWHTSLTNAGGAYRLCWCGWTGGNSSLSSCLSEQVDAGKLEVLGPNGLGHWAPTQRGHCGKRPLQPAPRAGSTHQNLTMDACRATCDAQYPDTCIVALFADRGSDVGLCSIMLECTVLADSSEDTLLLFPDKARPDIKQSRTCVSGQTCVIKGLLGHGLLDTDSYMLMDTCGLADALIERVDDASLTVSVLASNSTILLGSPLSAAGGTYRLCWCSGLSACSMSESFRTDAGGLVLLGPAPLEQDRTCVAGRRCVVDGVLGQDLADGDKLWILDTCGTASKGPSGFLYADSANTWLAGPAKASGAVFSWDDLPSSLPGGEYRLCWCSVTQACSNSYEYIVDIGTITLQGPWYSAAAVQKRTCVAGLSCIIDGLEGQLHGLAMILDTCGSARAFPSNSPVAASDHSGQMRWEVLTLQGGAYQLCWCTSGSEGANESDQNQSVSHCRSSLDFSVPFGALTLLGPEAGQAFTCVSGQVCAFDGIQGQGLVAEDVFLVLETCGTASPVGFGAGLTVPSWTAEGNQSWISGDWSWAQHTENLSFSSNGSMSCSVMPGTKGCRTTESVIGITWSQAVTAPAGTYQLCWCSAVDVYACTAAERFVVPSGQVLLRGPHPYQDRTCVAGQTCSLDSIRGTHLHEGDAFMILETCGTSFLPAGIPLLGEIYPNGTDSSSFEQGAYNYSLPDSYRISWGPTPFTSGGGLHRLCWCPAGDHCAEGGRHFLIDVGALHVVGPTANFNVYDRWLRGSCAVSQQISLHGEATKAQCFELGRYAPSTVTAAQFYSFGNSSSCALLRTCEDFVSTDGSNSEVLFLHSEAAQDRTCVSGLSCSIEGIMGLGLSAHDSFMVLDTCGSTSLVSGVPQSTVVATGTTVMTINGTNNTDRTSDSRTL